MAKVVLCSERVFGTESLGDLAACAVELLAQGHSVSLVCSDLVAANLRSEFDGIPLFQAPMFGDFGRHGDRHSSRPKNLSQLLIENGYESVDSLTPVLRAWLHLLATLDVDHVISDRAPTAMLASSLLSASSVMIGDGFSVPPKNAPLASFRPWRSEQQKLIRDQAQAFNDDQVLLESINGSFSGLGFGDVHITAPFEIYQHAEQWLMSVPEMDHYGKRDLPYVVRWPSTSALGDAV
ncbi:MAG: hypothetical protein ACJAQ6_000236 [Arenicella sp.]|jgi:hypothetical protein